MLVSRWTAMLTKDGLSFKTAEKKREKLFGKASRGIGNLELGNN